MKENRHQLAGMAKEVPRSKGFWIMITKRLPKIDKIECNPPPFSLWWAHYSKSTNVTQHHAAYRFTDLETLLTYGGAKEGDYPDVDFVKVKTPFGDLILRPEEYTVVGDMRPYLNEAGFQDTEMLICPFDAKMKGKWAERYFYMKQRGLPMVTIMKILIGEDSVKKSFHPQFYILSTPGLLDYFGHEWEGLYDGYYTEEHLSKFTRNG